jgi:cytochrome P450
MGVGTDSDGGIPVWRVVKAPGSLPVLGHAMPLFRTPLAFLAAMPSYGDLVEMRLGPEQTYMACHPKLVREILLNPHVFEKGGRLFDKARPSFGNGLVTCNRQEHRRQRSVLQPSFHRAKVDTYASAMAEEVDAVIASWRPGEPLMISEVMHKITIRASIRILLSLDGTDPIATEIQQLLPIVLAGLYYRTINPITVLEKIPIGGIRRHNHALAGLHMLVDDIIGRRRRNPGAARDMLSALLDNSVSESEIHDQIVTFLIAATETAGTLLTWAVYLLSRHPSDELRLADEARRATGNAFAGPGEFQFTRAVFTETLRMYPPTWILPRITTQDTQLGGQHLRAGTSVMYSPYVLQRNPNFFADPDRFCPDRWLTPRAARVSNDAMVPFGAGSRKCIGEHFAKVLGVLVLTSIATRWRLFSVANATARPVVKSTIGMSPLLMIPLPRETRSSQARR